MHNGLLQRKVQHASGFAYTRQAQLLALLVPLAGALVQWELWPFLRPYAFIFFPDMH